MAAIYVSTDTIEKVCPRCGAELITAEYLSATKGDSHLVRADTDWASEKKLKPYLRNIRIYKDAGVLIA